MVFEIIAPGIILIGRFGSLSTGVWIFEHNLECVLLEMPDSNLKDTNTYSWEYAKQYIQQKKLQLLFMTVSHAHGDHIASYKEFHKAFPTTPIIWHKTFFENASYFGKQSLDYLYSSDVILNAIKNEKPLKPSIIFEEVPIYCYKDDICSTDIGSEPFFMIHAPKHSRSDTMMIFRGCMISSDWHLGEGDPNKNRISEQTIQRTINLLLEFAQKMQYMIHSVFSVHANEFRRNINFETLMIQSGKLKP